MRDHMLILLIAWFCAIGLLLLAVETTANRPPHGAEVAHNTSEGVTR